MGELFSLRYGRAGVPNGGSLRLAAYLRDAAEALERGDAPGGLRGNAEVVTPLGDLYFVRVAIEAERVGEDPY